MKKKKIINSGNYYKIIGKRRAFICGINGSRLLKKEILFLKKYKPWGIILFKRNIHNISQTRKLTDKIRKIFKDKVYPIIIDEEGGRVSRLNNILDTSVFSAKFFGSLYVRDRKKFNFYISIYINQISYILKKLGININTVPVLDLYRKKYHKIIGDRSFSNNPKIVNKLGNLIIKKFNQNKIITVVKHIPGHGLAKVDSHKKLPIVNKKIKYLKKNDFFPFKKKNLSLGMTGHILFSQIDNVDCATHSRKVINLIRKEIGFKNILMSDDVSMKALKYSISESTRKAFTAGCNLVLHCNSNLKEMTEVAINSPFTSEFVIKKTSQLLKKLS